jgi:hypothetical protein
MTPFFRPWAFLCVLLPTAARSQELLEWVPRQYCLYHGDALPDELYVFPSDTVAEIALDLLAKTGEKDPGLRMLAANVPTILATYHDGQPYLLYNRLFFKDLADPALRLAMIAHALGHLLNQHTFGAPGRLEGELDADEYMGYALAKAGVAEAAALQVLDTFRLSFSVDREERRRVLLRGFKRATAHLVLAPSARFNGSGPAGDLAEMPIFPLPPKPSEQQDITPYFTACRDLAGVDAKLDRVLHQGGYAGKAYFHVPGGFALATRMEQFNADGSCKPETVRWQGRPVRQERFDLWGYLKALILPEPGLFRVFVFVATDRNLSGRTQGPPYRITNQEAMEWLSIGRPKLPAGTGRLPFTPGTEVTALIYEFQVPESTRKPGFNQPGKVPGPNHIKKSNLLRWLQQ